LEHGTVSPQATDNRSILIFALRDIAGALVQTLNCFARQSLNLAAIHSRAVPGEPGQYRFFVELDVGANNPGCLAALNELGDIVTEMSILGSYQTPVWPEAISDN
jgi:prephenate dehydratase